MSCYNTDREFVRSYWKWDPCKHRNVKVNVFRKKQAARPSYGTNPGQKHPQTGAVIPNPNDKYAPYPGPGFCRTVRVKRVKKYKVQKVRTLVSSREVSRTPVSGWHRCGSKYRDC
jgi:hypothetical protein